MGGKYWNNVSCVCAWHTRRVRSEIGSSKGWLFLGIQLKCGYKYQEVGHLESGRLGKGDGNGHWNSQ